MHHNSIDASRHQESVGSKWEDEGPRKYLNEHHYSKMAEMQGGDSIHVDTGVSPYSILRLSDPAAVDQTIQQITLNSGPRSTRAQLLRQLALRKKFEQNPFMTRNTKCTRDEAIRLTNDPRANDLMSGMYNLREQNQTQRPMQMRVRNRRGEYQSLEATMPQGVLNTDRSPMTADMSTRSNAPRSVTRAQDRLRTIEKISKYREDKIRKEF